MAVGPASSALARTGPEIAALFDSGVAAYDAGDYQKAFKIWWDLQYEDVAAMRNIAMMLRKGQGTAKDPKKAEEIFERAAQAGLPTAQADLADMLLKGEAGPPDLASACRCCRPPPPPTIRWRSSSLGNCTRPAPRRWCRRIWKWRASSMPPPPATA